MSLYFYYIATRLRFCASNLYQRTVQAYTEIATTNRAKQLFASALVAEALVSKDPLSGRYECPERFTVGPYLKHSTATDCTVYDLNSLTEDDKRILQTTEILLVQPSVVRRSPIIYDLPNLKWIQSLGAGIDQLIPNNQNNEPPPSFILTRNVGSFNRQMADFVVTTIIARERHFREFWENQTRKIWLRTPCRPLAEISVGIVGFGNIGKEVARVAKFFGLRVWALVRSLPTEITKSPDVDEYRLVPELGDVLSSCDYVVSVLPSTPSTDGFFDGDTLSKGKTKKPVFMNIGRGNVIRDSTVIHALNEGWITHAILDVFEKEPLPVDSPLWTHPQVSVIPHDSAGGFNDEMILRSFLENYERYINGKELLHTVDWKKGY